MKTPVPCRFLRELVRDGGFFAFQSLCVATGRVGPTSGMGRPGAAAVGGLRLCVVLVAELHVAGCNDLEDHGLRSNVSHRCPATW